MYTRPISKKGAKGQALVIAYMAIAFFMIVSAALIAKSFTERGIALRNRLTAETFYMAEGAIENAIATFTFAIANYQISPSIATYTVITSYPSFGGATVTTIATRVDAAERTIIKNNTIMYVRTYDFVATAVHPANNAIQTTVHQRIARRLIPTFQHAVFYNDDLEMLPGVTMTLAGRIHSNQDIYVDSKATLTIDTSYLYSAGDIFNRRKDTGLTDPGEVQIQVADTSPVQHQPMNGFDSNSPDWPTGDITRWNGTVKSAVNGVTKLTAPSVASIQPGDYYYTNAKTDGIIIQSDGTTTTIKKNNVALSCPSNTVTVTSSFKNNREGKNVTMVNINLAKLANLSGEKDPVTKKAYPNNLPSNGLLYATLTNSGSNEPGIRLVSGSQIERAAGLTVVSNQPVYIQGNYNTTSKKPASVIADSVNLLSAAWADDTNSTKSFASRQADPTTINCAFIAGIDTTASNQYNGGLENYPRLHEDWQGPGATLTIAGSFVELWNSAIAKGQWQYGTVGGKDYYTAPIRVWSYDSMFNDPTKLPPFTPWAVEAQRVAWW